MQSLDRISLFLCFFADNERDFENEIYALSFSTTTTRR